MKSGLQRWFDEYNRLYFDGRLPQCKVVWSLTLVDEDPNVLGDFDAAARPLVIRISKTLKGWDKLTRLTLLHEMVHVALMDDPVARDAHDDTVCDPKADAIFDHEMLKLAQKGALNGLW